MFWHCPSGILVVHRVPGYLMRTIVVRLISSNLCTIIACIWHWIVDSRELIFGSSSRNDATLFRLFQVMSWNTLNVLFNINSLFSFFQRGPFSLWAGSSGWRKENIRLEVPEETSHSRYKTAGTHLLREKSHDRVEFSLYLQVSSTMPFTSIWSHSFPLHHDFWLLCTIFLRPRRMSPILLWSHHIPPQFHLRWLPHHQEAFTLQLLGLICVCVHPTHRYGFGCCPFILIGIYWMQPLSYHYHKIILLNCCA